MNVPSFAAAAPWVPPPSPVPPSPFLLTLGKDDTALFQDTRVAFSHLLPGRPSLARYAPGDPPADAVVRLEDAPIAIRYRLEPPAFAASSAAELARFTAERFGSYRARASVNADLANETWLAAWGVEAGAIAGYDVGAEHEDLFVLVRQGMVMVVSWTCPKTFTTDPAFPAFVAVAEATLVWDPTRWEQRGRVWPASAFLEPGLRGAVKPKHAEAAGRVPWNELDPTERRRLLAMASGISASAGAPWTQLAQGVREASRRALLGTTTNPHALAFLDAALADVVTAQDLRGLAVIVGRALS